MFRPLEAIFNLQLLDAFSCVIDCSFPAYQIHQKIKKGK
jgi:hypothetical protein